MVNPSTSFESMKPKYQSLLSSKDHAMNLPIRKSSPVTVPSVKLPEGLIPTNDATHVATVKPLHFLFVLPNVTPPFTFAL